MDARSSGIARFVEISRKSVKTPTPQLLTPTEKLKASAEKPRAPCFGFVDDGSLRDLDAE